MAAACFRLAREPSPVGERTALGLCGLSGGPSAAAARGQAGRSGRRTCPLVQVALERDRFDDAVILRGRGRSARGRRAVRPRESYVRTPRLPLLVRRLPAGKVALALPWRAGPHLR